MAENKDVLLSLRRKLTQYEAADNTEKVKATKARIRELEKADRQSADLSEASVADLRKKAAEKDIEGRSSMDKEELIEALEETD